MIMHTNNYLIQYECRQNFTQLTIKSTIYKESLCMNLPKVWLQRAVEQLVKANQELNIQTRVLPNQNIQCI